MRRTVLALVGFFALACSDDPQTAAPEIAPLAPKGARVNIAVSGRGVVTSEPLGIRCGNDGDKRSCDRFFVAPEGGGDSTIRLNAVPNADWHFEGYRLVKATGAIAYDDVPGFDPKSPEATLDGRARRAEDGKERPAQYRLEAVFSPRSLESDQ